MQKKRKGNYQWDRAHVKKNLRRFSAGDRCSDSCVIEN
jgi:hypothetical protein